MSMPSSVQSVFLPQVADLEVSVGSEVLFVSLPTPLQRDQVTAVLARLTEEIKHVPFQASQAELRRFVQWALNQSYSDQLAPFQRMELLNLAWQVQKLLWSL